MAPGEGGLGFPSDDVVCGWHVLGDILEQRVGQELVTGGHVGPPFWWEWGSEALNSRSGGRGLSTGSVTWCWGSNGSCKSTPPVFS